MGCLSSKERPVDNSGSQSQVNRHPAPVQSQIDESAGQADRRVGDLFHQSNPLVAEFTDENDNTRSVNRPLAHREPDHGVSVYATRHFTSPSSNGIALSQGPTRTAERNGSPASTVVTRLITDEDHQVQRIPSTSPNSHSHRSAVVHGIIASPNTGQRSGAEVATTAQRFTCPRTAVIATGRSGGMTAGLTSSELPAACSFEHVFVLCVRFLFCLTQLEPCLAFAKLALSCGLGNREHFARWGA